MLSEGASQTPRTRQCLRHAAPQEVQQLIEGMSDLSAELPRLKEETRERRAALVRLRFV